MRAQWQVRSCPLTECIKLLHALPFLSWHLLLAISALTQLGWIHSCVFRRTCRQIRPDVTVFLFNLRLVVFHILSHPSSLLSSGCPPFFFISPAPLSTSATTDFSQFFAGMTLSKSAASNGDSLSKACLAVLSTAEDPYLFCVVCFVNFSCLG